MSKRCCVWPSLLSAPLDMNSVDCFVRVFCSLWPFLLYILLSLASPMAASYLSCDRFRFGCWVDLITLHHFVQFLGIHWHKQIHHWYIHHGKDMSTWFFCPMKLVYSSRKISGIISLNISIRGYVASQII